MKTLSVEWKAPSQLPNVRRQKPRVDIYFERVEALTKVRIEHSGWQWGEEWDEAYEFFDHAWDLDLARMQQRFASGPIDWSKPTFQPGSDTAQRQSATTSQSKPTSM